MSTCRILHVFQLSPFLLRAWPGGVVAALGASTAAVNRVPQPKSPKAKNLIFLVVDGMRTNAYGFAYHWSLRHRKVPLNWMQVDEHPGMSRAPQNIASASSLLDCGVSCPCSISE
jgi:hypothetical protein